MSTNLKEIPGFISFLAPHSLGYLSARVPPKVAFEMGKWLELDDEEGAEFEISELEDSRLYEVEARVGFSIGSAVGAIFNARCRRPWPSDGTVDRG